MARPTADQPHLSRPVILAAALRLLDAHGADKLSMRALSRDLGVSVGSLYHWFHNKQALLTAVLDEAFAAVVLPAATGDDWEQGLRDLTATYRALWTQHPALVPLLVQTPANTPAQLALLHEMHRLLGLAGVPADRIPYALLILPRFLNGFLLSLHRGDFGPGHLQSIQDAVAQQPRPFPHLATLPSHLDEDTLFETTVALLRSAIVGLSG